MIVVICYCMINNLLICVRMYVCSYVVVVCSYVCMYVGEHVCRLVLLCDPVI